MLREYKVVIMGSGGVGKSAITVRFVHSYFVEKYDPTIEDSYRKIMTVDGITCTLEIMDTAGTEQFLALQSMYMKSGHGFILVFSLTSMETVADLQNIHEQINRVKDARPGGRRVPLVLVGNKCDLVGERQVPREVAIGLSRKWGGTPYYEASARKEININEIFEDCVRQMIKAGAGEDENDLHSRGRRADGRRRKTRKCVVI